MTDIWLFYKQYSETPTERVIEMAKEINKASGKKAKKALIIALLTILLLLLLSALVLYSDRRLCYTVFPAAPETSFTADEKELINREIGLTWNYDGDIIKAEWEYNTLLYGTTLAVWIGGISDKDRFINEFLHRFNMSEADVNIDFLPNWTGYAVGKGKGDNINFVSPAGYGLSMYIFKDPDNAANYVAFIYANEENTDVLPSKEFQDMFWQKYIKNIFSRK